MTDVLILKNIAGHRAGAVTPLTERLEQHVAAGNAQILPAGTGVLDVEPPAPTQLHAVADEPDTAEDDVELEEEDAYTGVDLDDPTHVDLDEFEH